MLSKLKFHGQRVIVTGAGSGIGQACAQVEQPVQRSSNHTRLVRARTGTRRCSSGNWMVTGFLTCWMLRALPSASLTFARRFFSQTHFNWPQTSQGSFGHSHGRLPHVTSASSRQPAHLESLTTSPPCSIAGPPPPPPKPPPLNSTA